MAKKRLNQFTGALSPAQIAAGITAATHNARRLVTDANLLLESSRWPTATALAILAIEESGKASVLRELALALSDKEIGDVWRSYRAHTSKNVSWILPQLVASGARQLEQMRPIFDDASDHPQVLDQIKQVALYTDCLGDAHWSQPALVIDETLARSLVQTADVLSKGRDVSAQEIELWIKHIRPVWKRGMGWMNTALTNWHREMVAVGLLPDDEGFEHFLFGDRF